jgi:outer membrane protein assembly factor BamB
MKHHRDVPVPRLLSLVAILYTAQLSMAADWPNWRGPDYNGISTESSWQTDWPAEGPKILWTATVGTGFSSFAIVDGCVLTMGNADEQDAVICLDAATGEERWRHTYAEPLSPQLYEGGPNSTPTIDGNRVYTLSRRGKFHCFDLADGSVQWAIDLVADHGITVPEKGHWGLSGSPLVQGELVILNAGRAGMAFQKASGKLVWKTGDDAAAYATPVPGRLNGKPTLLVFAAKALVALDPETGSEFWQFPWETSWDVNAADPIITGNRVFISSGYGHGAALLEVSADGPVSVWSNKNMRNKMNGSVLVDGYVYGCDEKKLTCLDINTGKKQWSTSASGQGSLMVADGKLIILSDKGELIIADASPEAFTPIAQAQVLGGKCWTVPVLANGRIYARNAKGGVVCLDVSAN